MTRPHPDAVDAVLVLRGSILEVVNEAEHCRELMSSLRIEYMTDAAVDRAVPQPPRSWLGFGSIFDHRLPCFDGASREDRAIRLCQTIGSSRPGWAH